MRRLVPVLVLFAVSTAAVLRVLGVGINAPSPTIISHSSGGLALAPPEAKSLAPPTATLEAQATAEAELPAVDVPAELGAPPDLLGELANLLRARAAASEPDAPAEESPPPAPTSTVKPAAASAPIIRSTATPVPPPPPPVNLGGFAQQLFAAQNAARANNGVPPLALDAGVTAVAQARAQDMVALGYFGHTSPTGATAFTMLQAAGVAYKISGENIATNNYPDGETITVSMNGFLTSPAHRANLLNPSFTRVGIGFATRGDTKYFVIIFVG